MAAARRSTSTGSARASSQQLYTDLIKTAKAQGLLDRCYGFYWTYIVGLICCFALTWWGVVAVGDSWWQLALAVVLGLVVTQFGFVSHEAAHQQIFVSPTWNAWTSRILAGVFAGLGYSWWRYKHNRHHANPNRENSDPDIAPGAIAVTPAAAELRTGRAGSWFVAHQGWLFFPLLTLEGLNLHLATVRSLLTAGDQPHRRLELALVVARLTGYVVVLAVLLPPEKAVAFFVVQMGVFGMCLGGSFAPSHKGMPIVPPTTSLDFFRRQVLMSRNVTGGVLVGFAMGGLNRQIEHHLFPSMPRPRLRQAQPLVRAYCAQHEIPYTECTLLRSYAIVIDYLNHVGLRARGPFECPVTATLRN